MNQEEFLKRMQELENKIISIENRDKLKKKKYWILLGLLIPVGIVLAASITKPHTFSDGQVLTAGKLNENFDALYTKVNELDSTISQVIPVGKIVAYGGTSVPTGWLLCNRQALNRSTYSALFTTIGTSFGNGDGSTTFNVPDFRGRFLRGLDGTAGIDPDKNSRTALNGGNSGNNIGSFQDDEIKSHNHGFMPNNGFSPGSCWWDGTGGAGSCSVPPSNFVMSTGGNETRPKNVYVNFIIKH